jgi:predicted GIY-YIG superfamily endonuclease
MLIPFCVIVMMLLKMHKQVEIAAMDTIEYYVYMIKSKVDGTLYEGFTTDPEKRLAWHNNGETRSTVEKH